MMHPYSFRSVLRSAAVPLLALALGACSRGEANSGASAGQQLAMAAEAAPSAPVVTGLGAPTPEPAIADTIDLRTIGYSRGAEDAPVIVYEFSDFGRPFCGMFARGTYPELHRDFVETGKVRWTYVPVTFGFPGGQEGARAAECAAEQGKFWAMHDLLFAKQSEWKAERRRERLLPAYAKQAGLDADAFVSCYREDRGSARTALHNRAADALRVRATPSFFINGRLVEGALPAEAFRQLLTSLTGAE